MNGLHANFELIRFFRLLTRTSQGELAIKLGRSQGWVSGVEHGLRNPSPNDLRLIADALGVQPSEGVSWDVWIMPVGASMEQQQEHQERICMEAVERGYNFSPRVHNWIFGNRTGT